MLPRRSTSPLRRTTYWSMPSLAVRSHRGIMPDDSSMKWVRAASVSEVGEGDIVALDINGEPVALYRWQGDFFATSNICTHAFALLSEGWLDDNIVECPLHGGQF